MLRNTVREDTKLLHSKVEQSGIMKKIVDQTVTPDEYHQYLVDIYQIYNALHFMVSSTRVPYCPNHEQKIQLDINQIQRDWNLEEKTPSLSCISYVKYLRSIRLTTDENISRIMAHIYVRYLADLSGGKILKRILSKMNYPVDSYDFSEADIKDRIVTFINTQVLSDNAFIADTHCAFLCYDSILK
jgi:heme oxygenase (biliverdin-producing, ferredoxin)